MGYFCNEERELLFMFSVFRIFPFLSFIVTLDYKGLLLLMAKVDDENFLLGGQGLAVEFCIFCSALRVSLSYCIKKRGYSFN